MKKQLITVVLLVLALSLFWQCAKEKPEGLTKQMTQEIALLPANAAGVGFVNLAQIRKSEFYSMLSDSGRHNPFINPEYKDFVNATGLDLRRDINEIYFSMMPDTMAETPEVLAVILGKYNVKEITNYIAQKDTTNQIGEEQYKDYNLYTVRHGNMVFSFADDTHLVGGTETLVKKWLDEYSSPDKPANVAPEMTKRINLLRYKTGVWFTLDAQQFVNKFTEKLHSASSRMNLDALDAVKSVNFSMQFSNEMKFSGMSDFENEQKAKLFREAVKGFIATAKLTLSNDRDAIDVLNKIKVNEKGKELEMNFSMTKQDLEKLQQHRKQFVMN